MAKHIGDALMWSLLAVVAAIASMLLASCMARARDRSIRAWVWITAVIGPFGPIVLYLFGSRRRGAAPAS
jgi:hypothetical protein